MEDFDVITSPEELVERFGGKIGSYQADAITATQDRENVQAIRVNMMTLTNLVATLASVIGANAVAISDRHDDGADIQYLMQSTATMLEEANQAFGVFTNSYWQLQDTVEAVIAAAKPSESDR